jgi:hypothetical protein
VDEKEIYGNISINLKMEKMLLISRRIDPNSGGKVSKITTHNLKNWIFI